LINLGADSIILNDSRCAAFLPYMISAQRHQWVLFI